MIVIKKLATVLVSLFLISTLTFVLMKAIPGDPFSDEKALPASIHQALKEHYGLDKPWYTQYGIYLTSVATFDLGPSLKYKDRSVEMIIREGFGISLQIGLVSLFLALAIGICAGTFAALKANSWNDTLFLTCASAAVAAPSFVTAACLQYIFALKLGWLPLARLTSFSHTLLPAFSLSLVPAAFIARLVRANLIGILRQDYIKTARMKGLPMTHVIARHGLKNALLPLLPYLAQLTANIITGSFIIEKIFGIPGLGLSFVTAIQNRDYSVIMGVTLFYSTLLLLLVLGADLLHRALDPRLKGRL